MTIDEEITSPCREIKHPIDMSMPRPRNLKAKAIRKLIDKAIEEELGTEAAKFKIGFGDLDRTVLALTTIPNIDVRWDKTLELLQGIKESCKYKYFREF